MVQAKHKKSSLPRKKQPEIKSHGKKREMMQFCSQLDCLGLKVIEVTSDGNCFFRALADQIEGDESAHEKYREMVVKYIKAHREDFEPFIEDEVPFDEYCTSIGKDGAWAGHMELQAASLVTRSNICIHHSMLPRWYIRNFHDCDSRMVHISYHDGEHYNSIRSKDDPCSGPAIPITIKVDADVQEKKKNGMSKGGTQKSNSYENSVKMVMIGSGCSKLSKAEEVLQEVGGDVDAAIEYLIAERESDYGDDSDENLKGENACGGNDQSPKPSQAETPAIFQHDRKEASLNLERKRLRRPAARPSKSNKPGATSKQKDKGKKGKNKGVECKRQSQESAVSNDLGALCI